MTAWCVRRNSNPNPDPNPNLEPEPEPEPDQVRAAAAAESASQPDEVMRRALGAIAAIPTSLTPTARLKVWLTCVWMATSRLKTGLKTD